MLLNAAGPDRVAASPGWGGRILLSAYLTGIAGRIDRYMIARFGLALAGIAYCAAMYGTPYGVAVLALWGTVEFFLSLRGGRALAAAPAMPPAVEAPAPRVRLTKEKAIKMVESGVWESRQRGMGSGDGTPISYHDVLAFIPSSVAPGKAVIVGINFYQGQFCVANFGIPPGCDQSAHWFSDRRDEAGHWPFELIEHEFPELETEPHRISFVFRKRQLRITLENKPSSTFSILIDGVPATLLKKELLDWALLPKPGNLLPPLVDIVSDYDATERFLIAKEKLKTNEFRTWLEEIQEDFERRKRESFLDRKPGEGNKWPPEDLSVLVNGIPVTGTPIPVCNW